MIYEPIAPDHVLQPPRLGWPKLPWLLIVGFFLLSVGGCAIGAGPLMNLLFPLGALLIGFYLYSRYPLLYLGFVWWLWFLTPMIRRLGDYFSRYTEPSPMLLAPFLASAVTFITVYRQLPKASRTGSFPLVLSLVGVVYGGAIGLIQGPPVSSIVGCLDAAIPILLAFHIYTHWPIYPIIRQNMQRTFTWGALIMGGYGIYQYLTAPPWDGFWLLGFKGREILLDGSSFGVPEPFGIRVWSTMNSPLDFSITMMVALLILLSYETPNRWLASGLGALSFLLAQARAAWGGLVLGLLLTFASLKSSLQIRLFIIVIVAIACAVPLATVEPFSSIIADRLSTFTTLAEDGSGNARLTTYQQLLVPALTTLVGYGLGNVPDFGRVLDSSVLSMLFSVGLFGAIAYFAGWFMLLFRVLSTAELKSDLFAGAMRAVALSAVPLMLLGPIIFGVTGVMVWGTLGIAAAAQRYHQFSSHYSSQHTGPSYAGLSWGDRPSPSSGFDVSQN